jgi:hypothetical protein
MICGSHLLAIIYLAFALPSIPTLFAEESWVLPQIKEHTERGTLGEFSISAGRSTSIMQKNAMAHLYVLGGLSVLTLVASACGAFVARNRVSPERPLEKKGVEQST